MSSAASLWAWPAAEQGRPVRAGVEGGSSAPTAQAIGRAATLALYDELALSPKPGLVTLTSRGSHTDMDAKVFMRSLFALRGYFVRIAELGSQRAPFESLQRCGIAAEARMMAATGGVNTHRGAIFMLGLLCAAAGAAGAATATRVPDAAQIRCALTGLWGDALAARARLPSMLPGGRAAARHGLRGASMQAASGLPVVFETAAPALQRALRRGLPAQYARLDTLFHVIAVLDDSNLVHRGGLAGLRFAQACAAVFLRAGGASRPGGVAAAEAIGQAFVRRHLSPGGSADALAAACWLHRLGALDDPRPRPS